MFLVSYINNIYGLSKVSAFKIINEFGLNKNIKMSDLNKKKKIDIKKYINNKFLIDNKLKKQEKLYFKFLFVSKHYKSFRFKRGLPVRGQHSHNNGKTIKRKFKYFIKN